MQKLRKEKFAFDNGLLTNQFCSIKVSRRQYKFYPRVGVILEDLIGFPDQTSIKNIECRNNNSNKEQLIFRAEILLRKPFIENHNISDYFFGEEIALNCSMYMNEKYKPDFKWILPNINAISDLKEFRNRSLFSSILKIKNAYVSYSGQYVCRVSVLNRFESSTTKDIEIHASLRTKWSEIPSLLPPDKNITITLFITVTHFDESQPEVLCRLEEGCFIREDVCVEWIFFEINKLEKDIGSLNRYKSVFSIRPSTSGKLWCDVRSGVDFNTAETYLNVSDKMAPFMVTVRTENAFVNLTRPGTLETINATEGDNISIACFALEFLYYYNYFNSSEFNMFMYSNYRLIMRKVK
ncbi:hypothetical protein Avbf_15203 [Armadillidium vulgare]|nr:hypothetical protein Avbf_15203 [Armadillidium vulgare]